MNKYRNYWSAERYGFLIADIIQAIVLMAAIGLIGIVWGTFISVIVLSAIVAIAYMRQARTMAYGGPVTSRLRVEQIVIVNEQGIPRVSLDAKTGLQLADDMGRPRIVIAVDGDGPGFQVWDEAGKLQLTLGSSGANGIGLSLVDEAGKIRGQAVLRNESGGFASFVVRDRKGQVRGFFTSSIDGSGGAKLNFLDEAGNLVWHLDETGKSI
jgi:hypothetical protein